MIAKGKLVLFAGGAILAALLAGGAASASPSGGNGGGGGGPPGCDFDANLPSDMKAQVLALMTSAETHPALVENLLTMATAAEHSGYPKTAQCLRDKAAELKAKAQMDMAAKGGMDFTIRTGDIPYHLADYYTGQGSRFHELEPLNPNIGHIVTVNGVSNYQHWAPGMHILIPIAWNPLDKPLPAPLSGGGGSAGSGTGSLTAAQQAALDAAEAAAAAALEEQYGNIFGGGGNDIPPVEP